MSRGEGNAKALSRELDRHFRQFVTALPDYVVLIDRDRRFRWVSRIAEGLTEETIASSRQDDFVNEADRPRAIAAIERCFAEQVPTEYVVEAYGDGKVEAHYENRVLPVTSEAGEPHAIIISRDITDRVLAERRLRGLLEGSPDFILAVDADMRVVYVNRTDDTRTAADVVGAHVLDFVPEPAREEAREQVRAAIEDRRAGGWQSTGIAAPSAHFAVRVLPLDGPDAARALVQVQDISEQVEAQRALHASEERAKLAVADGRVGFWGLELETMIGSMSAAVASLLDLPFDRTTPKQLFERMHPADRSRVQELLDGAVAEQLDSFEVEYRIRDRDGRYRWFADRAAVIVEPDGRRKLSGTMFDVTELRAAQEREGELRRQLEQAQRLESIGLLAGGVAHDFNNLLTVILTGTKLAQDSAKEEAAELLEQVSDAATRAAELTQQLLAFSRRSNLSISAVDLVETASQVVSMARRLLPETIEIMLEAPSRPAVVRGDRGQLEQALLNLCINARDAMPDGGRLSLLLSADDDEVVIIVRDTGVGITAGDVERIFEPFFTTKSVGSGTGLGLAMVHGIVQQHDGSIVIRSEVGKGTDVELRLPRSREEVTRGPDEVVVATAGRGRILVAEDEPAVRAVVRRVLKSGGYDVVAAKDGQEAVEIYAADGGSFDLLLFDVVMPRLDGWKAYEKIRSMDPKVRILFSSGYAASAIPGHSQLARQTALVSKPYKPATLLAAVADALSDEPVSVR